jgi:hypothetical protein
MVIHITSSDHSTKDAPGGGYLDDAALISVLDHERPTGSSPAPAQTAA